MTGAVFVENPDGTYDLQIDRRTVDHDVDPEDFADALRRARVTSRDPVLVEDASGHQERLSRR